MALFCNEDTKGRMAGSRDSCGSLGFDGAQKSARPQRLVIAVGVWPLSILMHQPMIQPAGLKLAMLALLAPLLTGCAAVRLVGRSASTTIGVAADVSAASVRGAGKVAVATVAVTGTFADESIQTASKLSKLKRVVFFDPRTGSKWEVPVKKGLELRAAAEAAKLDATLTVLRIIRSGRVIRVAGEGAKLMVKSGDVVELARRIL
jgi:hypothetical protein